MLNRNRPSSQITARSPQITAKSSVDFRSILSSTGLHSDRTGLSFDQLNLEELQFSSSEDESDSPSKAPRTQYTLSSASYRRNRTFYHQALSATSEQSSVLTPINHDTDVQSLSVGSHSEPGIGISSQGSASKPSALLPARHNTMAAIAAIVVPIVLAGVKEVAPVILQDIKNLINQAITKFQTAHPGQSIWQVFGGAIAQLWRDNHIDQKLYNALHLGAFVAKISNFSKKLIHFADADPKLITPSDVVAHWDTAKLIDMLSDDKSSTQPATVRKNMLKLEPVGTMIGMLNKDKFPVPNDIKSHVVNVFSRFISHNQPQKPDPVPTAPQPDTTAPKLVDAKPLSSNTAQENGVHATAPAKEPAVVALDQKASVTGTKSLAPVPVPVPASVPVVTPSTSPSASSTVNTASASVTAAKSNTPAPQVPVSSSPTSSELKQPSITSASDIQLAQSTTIVNESNGPQSAATRTTVDDKSTPGIESSALLSSSNMDTATASVTPGVILNTPPVAPAAPKTLLTPQWLMAHPEVLQDVPLSDQPAVLKAINSMLRIQAISPTTTAMQELMKMGAPSSKSIIRSPKSAFVAANKSIMGVEDAQIVHNNAQDQVIRTENMSMGLMEFVRGSGLTRSEDGTDPATRKLQIQKYITERGYSLNLENLFGNMDDAMAPESRTVYGPAAYFVELLTYLRDTSLNPSLTVKDTSAAGTPDSIDQTVLQALFRRRPDLGDLQLTPENSETPLPYIDLVNEVMESFIVHLPAYKIDGHTPKQADIDVYNVTIQDSQELLSQPQNVSLAAYRQVATAAYPTTLPYHQPLDMQRIFLDYIKLPRAELCNRFRPKPPTLSAAAESIAKAQSISEPVNELSQLQKEVLDRQIDCERLGLIQEEYLILTKNVFWPPEFFSLTEGVDVDEAAYTTRIGLQTTAELWGYSSGEDLQNADQAVQDGLQFVKRQLLPRSGIAYTDLIDIVQTSFVNPNYPSGRDKTILDSLQFSYAFLSTLINDGSSAEAKYGQVADFLEKSYTGLNLAKRLDEFIKTQQTGDKAKKHDPIHIEESEIRPWVLSRFGAIGQIIVLDANQGPQLEVTGMLLATNNNPAASDLPLLSNNNTGKLDSSSSTSSIQDLNKNQYKSGPVGLLTADGNIKDGSGRIFARVDIAGRVIYGNPVDRKTLSECFPNYSFTLMVSGSSSNSWIVDGDYLKLLPTRRVVEWLLNPDQGGSANLDEVRLVHLNGEPLSLAEWDRLHRFIRIWRKLGWSITDTDRALAGINTCLFPMPMPVKSDDLSGSLQNGTVGIVDPDQLITFNNFSDESVALADEGSDPSSDPSTGRTISVLSDITPTVIRELAAITQLLKITGLPIEQLLTLWTNLPCQGPSSLFYRLFFTRGAGKHDHAFAPDANGDFFTGKPTKISDHSPVVMAALSIQSKDLNLLLGRNQLTSAEPFIPDILNMDNLSAIYRAKLFVRILGVSIADVSQIAAAFTKSAPSNANCLSSLISQPTDVLRILGTWSKIQEASFPWTELRYILDSVPTSLDPLAPTEIDALRLSKTLHDGVLEIQNANPRITDAANATDDFIQSKAALVFDSETVSGILGLVHGTTVYTSSAPVIENAEFSKQVNAFKTGVKYILGPAPPPGSLLTRTAKLQVTGILSSAQRMALGDLIKPFCSPQSLVNGSNILKQNDAAGEAEELQSQWLNSIARLAAQTTNLFYDALIGIFPSSLVADLRSDPSTVTLLAPDLDDKQIHQVEDYQKDLEKYNEQVVKATAASRKQILQDISQGLLDDDSVGNGTQPLSNGLDGDLPIEPPAPPQFTGQTPQAKALFFLRYFVPFLQAKLAHTFIIDNVADATGFSDHALAKTFLEQIITMDHSKQSAINFLLMSMGASASTFQGYLTPPATGDYTFYLPDGSQPNPITINSQDLVFSKTKVYNKTYWYTEATYPLLLNNVYTISLDSEMRSKLKWKQGNNAITNVTDAAFNAWRGYLNPPNLDSYVLSVASDTDPPSIDFDHSTLAFSSLQQTDPEKIYATDKVKLDPSKLYPMTMIGLLPSDLYWKSSSTLRSPVPTSSFLPYYSKNQTLQLFDKMKKMALMVSHFALSTDELVYIHSRSDSDDFDKLDFNSLKNISQWNRIYDYLHLRSSLPAKTTQSLIDLFTWSKNQSRGTENSSSTDSRLELAKQISDATAWPIIQIQQILAHANFTTGQPSQFVNETNLLPMLNLITYANQLGVEVPRIFEWASPLGTNKRDFYRYADIAQDIQKTVRAKFEFDAWADAVRPLNDTLRENQKNALIAYLLAQTDLTVPNNIADANGLFEYFLIDVQMTSLVQTSRLKQATSTVQLFVQRCMLGLEESKGVKASVLDRQRWQWMQKYRLWEGNRKIFLYPENWIDPSLRDDKSELFIQLEAELLQKDLTPLAVQTALRNYLFNVKQISNLQCIGLYVDYQDSRKTHIFARTRAMPYIYYYNWYQPNGNDGFWNGWQRMEVDIPHYVVPETGVVGNYVAPITFNGSLVLFIAQVMPYTVPNSGGDDTTTLDNLKNKSIKELKPTTGLQVQMGWSEYRDSKWTSRQICPSTYTILSNKQAPVLTFTDGWSIPAIDSLKLMPTIIQQPGSGRSAAVDSVQVYVVYASSPSAAPGVVAQKEASWLYNGTQLSKLGETATLVSGFTIFTTVVAPKASLPAAHFGYLPPTDSSLATIGSWQAFASGSDDSTAVLPALLQDPAPKAENAESYPYTLSPTTQSGPSIWLLKGIDDGADKQQFYHGIINQLLQATTASDLASIFKALANLPDPTKSDTVSQVFGGSGLTTTNGKSSMVFNERHTAYALYNWELGLHAPMIVIDRLFKAAQYEQALQICQYVFDPLNSGDTKDISRFWVFQPFKFVRTQTIEEYFLSFQPGKPNADVLNWRAHPFAPHVVARNRPQAYMKWIVMKYIQILIAWGDELFRQNSLESIPLAIQCYVYANNIYGPRGQQYPRPVVKPETYNSLMTKLDAFDNAVVQLEEAFPFSNQTPLPVSKLSNDSSAAMANVFGSAGTLYFAIPDNPDLRALASTIDDRLFKIRHSQDINGVFRQLPLEDPPIDPGLLVLAAAQGLNLNSVLADLNGPLPNCRFMYLLSKAIELTQEVKSFGALLLSNKEKYDGELLSNLHSKHELATNTSMIDLKKLALDDANASLKLLEYQRAAAVERLSFHFRLIGNDLSGVPQIDDDYIALVAKIDKPISDGGLAISPAEQLEMQKIHTAADLTTAVGALRLAAGIMHALPNLDAQGMPVGLGATVRFGVENFAKLTDHIAGGLSIGIDRLNFEAGSAARLNQQQRSLQDRILSANTTGYEISSIDKQITAAKIRIDMASREINMQQQQIDQAQEVKDFLQSKYTNAELYSWIDGQTKTLFYQTYSAAFALALKAQKAFYFERPQKASTSFIQPGYWNASRDGLLSGENLMVALRQLEAAYMEERGYDYEITKSVSLRKLDPMALIALRELGTCEFALPELIYDMDFPGHYMRRIKSVTITIPCLVGPYTSVNATLRLQSSRYRINATNASHYPEDLSPGADPDPRFSTSTVPIPAMAASSCLEDAGVFELRFDDSATRFLPFEGAGAISSWTLDLPSIKDFKQFDYDSITDVILRIRYTSLEGGSSLRENAGANVIKAMESVQDSASTYGLCTLFDIKNDFASGWSRMMQTSSPADLTIPLPGLLGRLPYFTVGRKPEDIIPTNLWILTDQPLSGGQLSSGTDNVPLSGNSTSIGGLHCLQVKLEGSIRTFNNWKLTFGSEALNLSKCLMVVSYTLK